MQDFIGGRLPDDERRVFEERLAREPALVHELEQSLQMREGLRQLRTQGYVARAASPVTNSRSWVAALLAAACAGLALFLWLSHATGPSPLLMASLGSRAANSTPLVATHFTFVSVRGATTPELDLPANGWIEMRARPGSAESLPRYRATLVRQDDGGVVQPVAALAGLALSPDGYVHFYADAARLAGGSYVLRIQPETDTPGMPEAFPFNLRAGVTGSSR